MATQRQKDEILKETNQIIALKLMRNKSKGKKRDMLVKLIDIAESDLNAKRKKYKWTPADVINSYKKK